MYTQPGPQQQQQFVITQQHVLPQQPVLQQQQPLGMLGQQQPIPQQQQQHFIPQQPQQTFSQQIQPVLQQPPVQEQARLVCRKLILAVDLFIRKICQTCLKQPVKRQGKTDLKTGGFLLQGNLLVK